MLYDDHQRLLYEAGGDISKAKFFNNVIGDPILDIPLENVKCIVGIMCKITTELTGVHTWFASFTGHLQSAMVVAGRCLYGARP